MARNPAADLCRRLRNPIWPESIPLSALEAMEEAARFIEAGLKPAPAKPAPLWYVATYGDSFLSGGFQDCALGVVFFDSPLAYGRACREAEGLHNRGAIDSYTMGRAEGPAADLARMEAARAKGAAIAARVRAAAADLKGGR